MAPKISDIMIHVYNVLQYVAVFVVPFALTVMTSTYALDLSVPEWESLSQSMSTEWERRLRVRKQAKQQMLTVATAIMRITTIEAAPPDAKNSAPLENFAVLDPDV